MGVYCCKDWEISGPDHFPTEYKDIPKGRGLVSVIAVHQYERELVTLWHGISWIDPDGDNIITKITHCPFCGDRLYPKKRSDSIVVLDTWIKRRKK